MIVGKLIYYAYISCKILICRKRIFISILSVFNLNFQGKFYRKFIISFDVWKTIFVRYSKWPEILAENNPFATYYTRYWLFLHRNFIVWAWNLWTWNSKCHTTIVCHFAFCREHTGKTKIFGLKILGQLLRKNFTEKNVWVKNFIQIGISLKLFGWKNFTEKKCLSQKFYCEN